MYVQHESVDSPFQPRFVAQRDSCSLGFGVSFCRLGTMLTLRLWFLAAWGMVCVCVWVLSLLNSKVCSSRTAALLP